MYELTSYLEAAGFHNPLVKVSFGLCLLHTHTHIFIYELIFADPVHSVF